MYSVQRHDGNGDQTLNPSVLAVHASCVWSCRGTRDLRGVRDLRRLPSRIHLPCGCPLGLVLGWLGVGLQVKLHVEQRRTRLIEVVGRAANSLIAY